MGIIRVTLKANEKYVYLAHLTDSAALIAFGKFYFSDQNELIDDSLLRLFEANRTTSIGEGSEYYGEQVEVRLNELGTNTTLTSTARKKNYCWVEGLKANTRYKYEVFVDGVPWIDRNPVHYSPERVRTELTKQYDNSFRTFPHPDEAASCTFAVLGDYGSGKETQIAIAEALEKAVEEHGVQFVISTGDNIYKGAPSGTGHADGSRGNDSGEDDDDWFFTFFQPYRFVINRVPVFPTIGNHDSSETPNEGKDDRDGLYDNMFVVERFNLPVGRGPGLFYSFRFGSEIEFICLDSSEEEGVIKQEGGRTRKRRVYEDYRHKQFIEDALSSTARRRPQWRIPFLHHSAFSDGDRHSDDSGVQEQYSSKFRDCGVRVCLSGHSHNFQWLTNESVNYIVSGGAGKPEEGMTGTTKAVLKAWGGKDLGHFLIVRIDIANHTMEIIPYTENGNDGTLVKLPVFTDITGRTRLSSEIRI